MRVLLIDYEPTILAMLQSLLVKRGCSVQTAVSAQQAKQEIEHSVFDLILTDMRMETPTAGFDVIHAARATSYHPIIAILTAFPLPSADWRRAGADAMFMKGEDVEIMLGHLQQLLRLRRR